MASMTENTPMKTPTNHNKRRPGTKNEVQTPILIRNSERQCKTRVINALKAQASRIRRLKTEPCEVLFVIRELKTDKYKFMGYGDVLNRFIEGKPITSCVNYKRQKYTIPRIQDLPNKVQTLTPEKYAFSFTPRSVSLKQQQKTSLSSPQFRTEENETSTSERYVHTICA